VTTDIRRRGVLNKVNPQIPERSPEDDCAELWCARAPANGCLATWTAPSGNEALKYQSARFAAGPIGLLRVLMLGTTEGSELRAEGRQGRLLFPLHAEGMVGGMLLIRKPEYGATWPARFISAAAFVSLVGGQNAESAHRLYAAFVHGGKESVQSFRIDEAKDDTCCWFAGDGWWLSTSD
jgi:hypothetical protein